MQAISHKPKPINSLRVFPSMLHEAQTEELPRFVVQKHHARTLHYDLWLEKDGVFKSWALPKIGLAPITRIGACPIFDGARRLGEQEINVKALAIQVADHDPEFGDFEAEIPVGQYADGKSRNLRPRQRPLHKPDGRQDLAYLPRQPPSGHLQLDSLFPWR